ncbi:N(pi)-phosphohistidine--sugar phosphotransferase, partial [Lacticaseibacillus rhamnosus]
MKDKLQKITQTFGRSILQPVMFMAGIGILISVAAVMKLEQLPDGIKNVGTGLFTSLTSADINQLSV